MELMLVMELKLRTLQDKVALQQVQNYLISVFPSMNAHSVAVVVTFQKVY